MSKPNFFSLTDKFGNRVNASNKVIKVYTDDEADTLAVDATDVVSNIVTLVDSNNPYRLKIDSILGGDYYLKADGEAEIFPVNLKASADYTNQDVQDLETAVGALKDSKTINLIPNADLRSIQKYTTSQADALSPNLWFYEDDGKTENAEIVTGLDVPNLLDYSALKIDLLAGQEVRMYSGRITSTNSPLILGTSKISGGFWLHADDWGAAHDFDFGLRPQGSFADRVAFSSYKSFGNWRFYYFENENTHVDDTSGYKYYLRFKSTGVIDMVLHISRIVLIEGDVISPIIYTSHHSDFKSETRIDFTNDRIDLLKEKSFRHGKNPIPNPIFEQSVAGIDPQNGWSFAHGGTGAHASTHVVDNTVITPFGKKSVKIGVDYVASNNFADCQARIFINREPQYIGADKFSYLFYIKREDAGISIEDIYFQYRAEYDGAGAYVNQFSSADDSKVEIIGNVGEWELVRYQINVPAGWEDFKSIRLGCRLKGSSGISGAGFKYAWLTGFTVNFDPNEIQEYFNPNLAEEITNEINVSVPSVVSTKVIDELDNRQIISGDKKNFGSRIKKTLIKLFSTDSITDSKPQRLLDDHVRIVHLGDSIVYQGFAQEHLVNGVSGAADNLDFIGLRERYKNANFSFVNAGVGGQTAYWFRHHILSQVKPYSPDLVIISTWGNDNMDDWEQDADEFERYYEQMVKQLKKDKSIDIMICSYSLYPRTYENVANSPGHKVLKKIATKYDCEFVDIAKYMYEYGLTIFGINSDAGDIATWYDEGYYSLNDVHPLTKGKQLMAKAISEHFPRINEHDQDFFDWNGPLSNIHNREQRIELVDAKDYLDEEIVLSDEDAFVKSTNGDFLESSSATADNEYIEIDFIGHQVDMIYLQDSEGANADILIDNVLPSTVCKNTHKFPDADNANNYPQAHFGSERDAKPRYVLSEWRTAELITITMTGTVGVLSTTFDISGSVSGSLNPSPLSNALEHKLEKGSGEFIIIRPEMWAGRTTNIYGGDKFYIYMENAQAANLFAAGDRQGAESPLITVADTLDDSFLLRFAMTDANNFRIDRVSKEDYGDDIITTNVLENIGTGDFTALFNQGSINISLAELQRTSNYIDSGDKFYYYVNRKYSDMINMNNTETEMFKRVTLVSDLVNKEHTIRITKNGTDKLKIASLIVKN